MRIGIDIDGVLTDMESFEKEYCTKYCVDNNIEIKVDLKEYDETLAYNFTEEQTEKFWNEYMVYYATKYPARQFASEVINKLKELGNEIYIITARNEYGLPEGYYGRMHELVNKWLEDNQIEYDKIIYTEGNKLPYCIGNYIEVMIEDSPEQIKNVGKEIKVLCFHSKYNEEVEDNKNITRVYSWYDVYNKIENLK